MFQGIREWWAARRRAADNVKAARTSAETAEDRVVQKLGRGPRRDSYEYRQHVAGQDAAVRLEERREDLRAAEDVARGTSRPFSLDVGIVVLVGVELVGVLGVLRGLDVPPSQRLFAGAGVLIGAVGLTAILAILAGRVRDARRLACAGWAVAFVLLAVVYGLVLAAFVATRVVDADSDHTLLVRIAEGIVIALATAAPPWALKAIWTRRAPARRAWGDVARLRREVKELRKEAAESAQGLIAFERAEGEHAARAAKIRATHAVERRELEARLRARGRVP